MKNLQKILTLFFLFYAGFAQASFSNPQFLSLKYYEQGKVLAADGKNSAAMEKFAATIEMDPNFLSAYIEWARVLVLDKRRKEALEKLAIATKKADKPSDLERIQKQRNIISEIFFTNETFQQYQNGFNRLKKSEIRASTEFLEQAMATEPFNVLILATYAQALSGADDWIESIKMLEKAYSLNPQKELVRELLGRALLERNPERAKYLLEPLARRKNSAEFNNLLFAQALFNARNGKDAIKFLEKKLAANPDGLKTIYMLGQFHSKTSNGNWMARRYLKTFLKRTSKTEKLIKDWTEKRAGAKKLLSRINQDLGLREN